MLQKMHLHPREFVIHLEGPKVIVHFEKLDHLRMVEKVCFQQNLRQFHLAINLEFVIVLAHQFILNFHLWVHLILSIGLVVIK